jgi:hypothetical protein
MVRSTRRGSSFSRNSKLVLEKRILASGSYGYGRKVLLGLSNVGRLTLFILLKEEKPERFGSLRNNNLSQNRNFVKTSLNENRQKY